MMVTGDGTPAALLRWRAASILGEGGVTPDGRRILLDVDGPDAVVAVFRHPRLGVPVGFRRVLPHPMRMRAVAVDADELVAEVLAPSARAPEEFDTVVDGVHWYGDTDSLAYRVSPTAMAQLFAPTPPRPLRDPDPSGDPSHPEPSALLRPRGRTWRSKRGDPVDEDDLPRRLGTTLLMAGIIVPILLATLGQGFGEDAPAWVQPVVIAVVLVAAVVSPFVTTEDRRAFLRRNPGYRDYERSAFELRRRARRRARMRARP